MKLYTISEPELEFGEGKSVCPKDGILNYHVYDSRHTPRRDQIIVGAVGESQSLEKLGNWLDRCASTIPPKLNNHHPSLFTGFPGFNKHNGFKAEFVYGDNVTRTINHSETSKIIKNRDWNSRVDESVELYYKEIKFLAQNRSVDTIICIIPNELYDKIAKESHEPVEDALEDEKADDLLEMNFRRALKAKSMHLGVPLQLMRELSLEPNPSSQQDDATRAWNFCTALYYKSGKTVPWKLSSNINRPSICFVGIGFYRSRDRKVLHTSLAQIFNELGDGVILRGTPVEINKEDRQPHLSEIQAYDLLKHALEEYKFAVKSSPGRLVMHKSSNYTEAELSGFTEAAEDAQIHSRDFITLLSTEIRLLREGDYPPLRGTHIELDSKHHLLYTRGSVPYYMTYTGLYIPQPLEVRIIEADESPSLICEEILGLTKMNWNNTQFDGRLPITIQCAKKVGEIMKYLKEDEQPQIRYSYYM